VPEGTPVGGGGGEDRMKSGMRARITELDIFVTKVGASCELLT